jgi:hypothetical protein
MSFELPSGLPEGPWSIERDDRDGMDWNNHIVDAYGGRICFMAHSGTADNSKYEAAACAIISILDMAAEIGRLRKHGGIELATRRDREIKSLRALNAEMREALEQMWLIAGDRNMTPEEDVACEKARSLLGIKAAP